MADKSSVDFFLRFLNERFRDFLKSRESFLFSLAGDDRAQKVKSAQRFLDSLRDLKSAMATNDHPGWMGPLEQKLNWYCGIKAEQPDAGLQLLQVLFATQPAIDSQQWNPENLNAPSAIDFAAIYGEYYRSSKVPELFDQLVTHLQAIIESGAVDSIQTIRALEKLIATIRRNARGDYFSTRGTLEFARVFLQRLTVETLESIPGIKQVVKALRQTMSELDIEMLHVHDEVKKRLTTDIRVDLPMLEYKPRGLPAPMIDVDVEVSEPGQVGS